MLRRPNPTRSLTSSYYYYFLGGGLVHGFLVIAQYCRYCPKFTSKLCVTPDGKPCNKLHFREIIKWCTDKSLGDCTFLTNCMRGPMCKFIHYEVDPADIARLDELDRKPLISKSRRSRTGDSRAGTARGTGDRAGAAGEKAKTDAVGSAATRKLSAGIDAIETSYEATDKRVCPPQWIQCDVRKLNLEVLGKFTVIMADPPWRIHMDLP
jgi:mRNA (2'-O-methyladenosine-N6-)-methyltransferase